MLPGAGWGAVTVQDFGFVQDTVLLGQEVKLADSLGDRAWVCLTHAEEILVTVPTAFIASHDERGIGIDKNSVPPFKSARTSRPLRIGRLRSSRIRLGRGVSASVRRTNFIACSPLLTA